jgi:hypothetical protein
MMFLAHDAFSTTWRKDVKQCEATWSNKGRRDVSVAQRYNGDMSEPIILDIPHKLGKIAAHDRLDRGIGKIGSLIPGGGAVHREWDGDTMKFTVTALGQTMTCRATVFEDKVHASVDLPPMLALFSNKIRASLNSELPKLLT